jgi:uncharacterized membrane protein
MKAKKIISILASILILSYFSYISIKIIEVKTGYDIEGKITGLATAGAGLLLSRPRSASFIMIFIIVAIIYYFNRERIKNLIEKIKGKREEEI